MTATVKSNLNPMAISFIPSMSSLHGTPIFTCSPIKKRKFEGKYGMNELSIYQIEDTAMYELHESAFFNQSNFNDERNYSEPAVCQKKSKLPMLKKSQRYIDQETLSDDSDCISTPEESFVEKLKSLDKAYQSDVDRPILKNDSGYASPTGESFLEMKTEDEFYQSNIDQKIVKDDYDCISTPEESLVNEVETNEYCQCPEMFGWVVPPNVFGNLFSFKYNCNKNYYHIGSNDPVNLSGLDKYYREYKDIVNDVYECLNYLREISTDKFHESLCSPEKESKLSAYSCEPQEKRMEYDEPIRDRWNADPVKEVSNLVDDGCHPLLEMVNAVESEDKDDQKLIETTRKILQASFQQIEGHGFFCGYAQGGNCIAPCSVWCNNLPTAAKDIYMKSIKEITKDTNEKNIPESKLVWEKPLYKRSLSADDPPKYAVCNKSSLLPISGAEAIERLILLQKNPLAYKHNALIKRTESLCSDLSSCKLKDRSSTGVENSMWGPFDGPDSLWQPLPDCVPSKDNSKQNIQKKARDLRRLKSAT